jgi:putative chitinase
MIGFDPKVIIALCPRAHPVYTSAFKYANSTLVTFGILNNERRLVHFLAQILHESGGLTLLRENLYYSAERLTAVWPSRFPTLATAREYADNPQKLANYVYANRLGNTEPNDGWTFRGRGLVQLTGRSNYEELGRRLNIELIQNPESVLFPEYTLQIAGSFWQWKDCNKYADKGDLRAVTKALNGGYIGLQSRRSWYDKVARALNIIDALEA